MWSFLRTPNKTDHSSFQIITERLLLRPARLDDFQPWEQVRRENQAFLKQYEPSWPAGCLEKVFFARRCARLDEDWAEDRSYCFLIFNGETSALIGGINVNNVVRGAAQFASLGYWLDEHAQGNGYMGEAADAVLAYAFNTLSLYRMNAATLPDNQKSMAMLGRCGFEREGFAKAYIQIDGKRRDHVLFGLTRDTFAALARKKT